MEISKVESERRGRNTVVAEQKYPEHERDCNEKSSLWHGRFRDVPTRSTDRLPWISVYGFKEKKSDRRRHGLKVCWTSTRPALVGNYRLAGSWSSILMQPFCATTAPGANKKGLATRSLEWK